jgi:hypothetical protein
VIEGSADCIALFKAAVHIRQTGTANASLGYKSSEEINREADGAFLHPMTMNGSSVPYKKSESEPVPSNYAQGS